MFLEGIKKSFFYGGVAGWVRASLDTPMETRREFIDNIHQLMDDKDSVVGKFSDQVFRNNIAFSTNNKTKQLAVAVFGVSYLGIIAIKRGEFDKAVALMSLVELWYRHHPKLCNTIGLFEVVNNALELFSSKLNDELTARGM